jgi:hypothetical protein
MSTSEQRVDRGFAKMTDVLGAEWVCSTNPASLDMESMMLCPLGQNFGTYNDGLKALGLTHQEAPEYGFNAMTERWSTLRASWGKRIRAAQKELEK